MVKNPPAMWDTRVWSLGWEDPLEEGMATYSSIPAWRIPWTEEQRVKHDWATKHPINSRVSLSGFPNERMHIEASPVTQWERIQLPVQKTWVWSLICEDSLEKEIATHSSLLAWEILWTEQPGGLQSMGSQKSWTQLSDWHTNSIYI